MSRALPIGLVLGLLWAAAASAQTTRGLVVIPRSASEPGLSYLRVQAQPGQTEQAGAIELLNPTDGTLRVALAPVDGKTLDTLGSSYSPSGSGAHGSTRWLQLDRRTVELAPHAHELANVTVRVPRGAAAGDHLSGISVEQLEQAEQTRSSGRGTATASVVRYAIGVEIALPGARRPSIHFSGAAIRREPAGLVFELGVRNAGNVILQGVRGSVRVTRDGRTVLTRPIPPGTFLAGTSISYPVPAFGQQPLEGTRYRIQATLRYTGGVAKLNRSVTFGHRAAVAQQSFGGPAAASSGGDWWKLALVIAVILYGLLTTGMLLRRRRRHARHPAEPAHGGFGPGGQQR
jgi:hypothetical protein